MYIKKTLELTIKMFPEFEILVEIYKLAFWCIAKKKLSRESILIYFSRYYLKAHLVLSPHTGMSEIQR